ncbi:MAG: hypothetical protein ACPLZG_10370 [Thermoproteota archaeon]
MNEDVEIKELFVYTPASLELRLKVKENETLPIIFINGIEDIPEFKIGLRMLKYEVVKYHFFFIIPYKRTKIVIPFCPLGGGDLFLFHIGDGRKVYFSLNKEVVEFRLSESLVFDIETYMRKIYRQTESDIFSPYCHFCQTHRRVQEQLALKEVEENEK